MERPRTRQDTKGGLFLAMRGPFSFAYWEPAPLPWPGFFGGRATIGCLRPPTDPVSPCLSIYWLVYFKPEAFDAAKLGPAFFPDNCFHLRRPKACPVKRDTFGRRRAHGTETKIDRGRFVFSEPVPDSWQQEQ